MKPQNSIFLFVPIFLLVFVLMPLSGHGAEKAVKASQQELEDGPLIGAREKAVAVKEKELAIREKSLKDLAGEIDVKIGELTALQADLKEKIAELKSVQDQEFKNLIKVYSTMSPSKLTPLLNQMDDKVVARILRAMKTDFVAKVIPKLEQEKAVRVSQILGML